MPLPNLLTRSWQLLSRTPGAAAIKRQLRRRNAQAPSAAARHFRVISPENAPTQMNRSPSIFRLLGTAQDRTRVRLHATDAPEGTLPTSNDGLEALSGKTLFILGAARSGTTILKSCLNRSPDILLLAEADFWQNPDVADYAQWFNDKHQQMRSAPSKGNYLPPPQLSETGSLALLKRLAQSHRYVGEKMALGPHYYPTHWQRSCLDFHAQNFYNGRYLLILRHPAESMWSMSKMFSDRTAARSVLAWIESVTLQLDFYSVFPQVRVVFFDRLNTDTLGRLRRWLHVRLPIQGEWLSAERINTRVEGDSLPPVLAPYEEICRRSIDVYASLRDTFCPWRLRVPARVPPQGIMGKLRRELDVLAELAREQVDRAESAPAPASKLQVRGAA